MSDLPRQLRDEASYATCAESVNADVLREAADALEAAEKHIAWLEHFSETERVRYANAQQGYIASIREGLARERVLHDRIADLTNPGWRKPEPIKGDM